MQEIGDMLVKLSLALRSNATEVIHFSDKVLHEDLYIPVYGMGAHISASCYPFLGAMVTESSYYGFP